MPEKYRPTEEEIIAAEEMMTNEQREMSEGHQESIIKSTILAAPRFQDWVVKVLLM